MGVFRNEVRVVRPVNINVQRASLYALMTLGVDGPREAAALLGDEDIVIRRASVYALGQLTQGAEPELETSVVVKRLAQVLAVATDPVSQQTALHALALMGANGACEVAGAMVGHSAAAREL